jgi:DNA-directed RNA polymerase subunit RPC12/RpoP
MLLAFRRSHSSLVSVIILFRKPRRRFGCAAMALFPIRRFRMSVLRCAKCNLPMTGDEVERGVCPSCGAKVDAEKRTVEEAIAAPIWTPDPSHTKYPAPKRSEDDHRIASVVLQGHNHRVTMPLPHVCVRCGHPSDTYVEKNFLWWPAWANLLTPFAPMFMTQRMTVKLPVCNRHRNPWLAMQFFAAAMLFYFFVVPIGAIFIMMMSAREGADNRLAIDILIGWLVGLPIVLGLVLLMRRRTILPQQITRDQITLWGVCRNFADRVGRQSHIH